MLRLATHCEVQGLDEWLYNVDDDDKNDVVDDDDDDDNNNNNNNNNKWFHCALLSISILPQEPLSNRHRNGPISFSILAILLEMESRVSTSAIN